MARPSTRFISVSLAAIVWISAALTVLVTRSVNGWLAAHQSALRAQVEETLGRRVRFSPPHYLPWRGVVVPALESPGQLSNLSAREVRLVPSIHLTPRPGIEWHVILEKPSFVLPSDARAVLQLGRQIAASPPVEAKWGPFIFPVRLGSFQLRNGKGSLVSQAGAARAWRQDFEGLKVVFGKAAFGGERLVFEGHIAGKPQATFRIHVGTRGKSGNQDTRIHFDCRQFTTAYLEPHLGSRMNLPEEEVTASIRFKMRGGRTVLSEGRLSIPRSLEGVHPVMRLAKVISPKVRYKLKATLEGGSVTFNELEFKTPGMKLTGGGEAVPLGDDMALRIALESERMPLARLAAAFADWRFESGDVKLGVSLRGTLKHPDPGVEITFFNCQMRNSSRNLSLGKLDGRLEIGQNRWVVDELWFFANDFPLRLKGEASWTGAEPSLFFELESHPGQIPSLRRKNPLTLQAVLSARRGRLGWDGSAWLRHTWRHAGADGHNEGTVRFRAARRWGETGIKFGAIILDPLKPEPFRRLVLKRGRIFAERENGGWGIAAAARWAGSPAGLRGVAVDPLTWDTEIHAPRADVAEILSVLGYNVPATGRLRVNATASHSPLQGPLAQARFTISRGAVSRLGALDAMADQTGIEPLRNLVFDEAGGTLDASRGKLDFPRLFARGPDAALHAAIRVLPGSRLSGRIVARFPERTLRKSSDLRWLLHFVGGREAIDFDFQVAGSAASPRVRWLGGEFKRRLETYLAPWMRQILARELEKRLGVES